MDSDERERLEDGAAVAASAAEIVDLAAARGRDERLDELRDVERVDVVAHLLALVAEDRVAPAFEIALHEVAQEAVQLARRSGSAR